MGDRRFKGLEIELHRYSGARVLRVVHPQQQDIHEHRHDWSYIGLHTLGTYIERYDGGEAEMAGPSAVFHPAGRPHSDQVGDSGLETLTIEFDRSWLARFGFDRPLDRSLIWSSGTTALAARKLARAVSQPSIREREVGLATARFLSVAMATEPAALPAWLLSTKRRLSIGRGAEYSTRDLARTLDLHPAWLARAYRAATGEGLHETVRRRRVESACSLLRRSNQPLAEIAAAAGFCDQSHMNRAFKATLGRTPLAVRSEACGWRPQTIDDVPGRTPCSVR